MRALRWLVVVGLVLVGVGGAAAKERAAVELTGSVSEWYYNRNWSDYYWREDFSFILQEEGGKKWRIISREPTPAYDWRMGTTYTGLKVDWKKPPRVKLLAVTGVDRQPATFYDFKLDEPNVATALVLWVEIKPDEWKEYYVNNWFHKWGDAVDPVVHKLYADKGPPYEVYGFINGQHAPFSKQGQALIKDAPKARMFHGVIKATKDNLLGYEIELLHLVGPDEQGNGKVFFGEPGKLPLLEKDKAKKEAQTRFVDVTAESGIKIANNTGVGGTNPHAVAVEDFNGDGLPDILIATFGKPHVRYFQNLGGLKFKDVTKGCGLEAFVGDGTGAAVADFDHDGKLDVYLTSLRKGGSRLFKGRGDGRFDDVSEKAKVLLDTPARSCAWSDIDGDGYADLYVTCPDGANVLFRNNRDGTFTDIAKSAGVDLAGRHCLGCAFGDYDGDGLDDLFVACYKSQASALFKNTGKGTFKDVTEQAGLGKKMSAVGCVFADVHNAGRLDLFVSTDSWLSGANYTEKQLRDMGHTVEPNVLYLNDGKGGFKADAAATLAHKTLCHDAVLEDLDHDGLVDLYVGVDAESGNQWATSKGGNPLWTRPDGKTWENVAKAWGVEHAANCVCVPAVDLDNDGDLDLVLVNFYSNAVVLRNDTNDKNWLRVKAVGTKSNPDGIGATVRVYDGKRLVGMRQVQSGAGYCRCSPLEVHFGLGAKPAAGYRVEVVFAGTGKKVEKADVKPGQRLVMREE